MERDDKLFDFYSFEIGYSDSNGSQTHPSIELYVYTNNNFHNFALTSFIYFPHRKKNNRENLLRTYFKKLRFFALVCYYIITPCVHIITKYFSNNDQELFDFLIFLFSRVQTFSVLFSLIYFSTF
jgi:hypothetical protein